MMNNYLINYSFYYRGAQQHKTNYREKEKEVLDQILGPGSYDARIRPSGINGTGKSLEFFLPSKPFEERIPEEKRSKISLLKYVI